MGHSTSSGRNTAPAGSTETSRIKSSLGGEYRNKIDLDSAIRSAGLNILESEMPTENGEKLMSAYWTSRGDDSYMIDVEMKNGKLRVFGVRRE